MSEININKEINEALAGNYLLVTFSNRVWQARATDKDATAEINSLKHATSDAAKVIKNLFANADSELRAVKSAYSKVRTFVYAHTMPFTSNDTGAKRGPRLLATASSLEFMKEYNVLQQEAFAKLADLKRVYPQRVQEAIANLGGMGDATQYPDATEIDRLFDMRVEFDPVPAQAGFNNMTLPPKLAEYFIKRMEKRQASAIDNALADLKGRIIEELLRITKQLSRYADGEKVRLYKSLIGNIKRLNEMLRSANLSGNADIEAVCNEIERKLTSYTVEQIQASPGKAGDIANDAKSLASAVEAIELF